jgi:hypothetical protein
MKLPLTEIWEFLDLLDAKPGVWHFDLIVGQVKYEKLSVDDLISINEVDDYDVELLPSLFTYREILWQPNVYNEPQNCLPSLSLLNAYCKDFVQEHQSEEARHVLYNHLLGELSLLAEKAVEAINSQESPDLARILGDFRNKSFPIVKFFIWHPRNRKDHVQDALKRLNYTVKILLTQYHNDYGQLSDPYWEVTKSSMSTEVEVVKEQEVLEAPQSNGHSVEEDLASATVTAAPIEITPSVTT